MSDGRSLYEKDFVRWSAEQAAAIRAAAATGTNLPLDWENLAEEIESLGRSQRSELTSRTRTLVEHLLKLECSSAMDPRRGCTETVLRTRLAVDDLLRVSPSLRRELSAVLDDVQASTCDLTGRLLVEAGEVETGMEGRLRSGGYTAEQVFGSWFPDWTSH